MKHRITALVPAYNEGKEIRDVLEILSHSPSVDEIICVDDGSSDDTSDVAKSVRRVKVLRYKRNHGKAYAIARGIEKAKGDIVIFVDADIIGLTDRGIKQLITPLIKGTHDCTIGYRSSRMEATVGRPLSGERAYFRKDLLPLVKKFEKKGYGLELYLNYRLRDKRIRLFHLRGVYSRAKHDKQPYQMATKLYAKAFYQVLGELVKQGNVSYLLYNFYLRRLYDTDNSIARFIFSRE